MGVYALTDFTVVILLGRGHRRNTRSWAHWNSDEAVSGKVDAFECNEDIIGVVNPSIMFSRCLDESYVGH